MIGVPSMRLLKTIAVFTPEPWQGYGFGADWSEAALNGESNPDPGQHLRWGDSHHPALSETDGKYDGRWLYINAGTVPRRARSSHHRATTRTAPT